MIDMGGSGQDLTVADYSGKIKIINKTGANDVATITLDGGEVELDSTVTAGTVIIMGVGDVIDNSNGATIINKANKKAMTVGQFLTLKDA